MSWNPPVALEWLLPLLILAVAVGVWLSWRSNQPLAAGLRLGLTGLRALALALLALFLLNPGVWKQLQREASEYWALLLDGSASMAVAEDPNEPARLQRAQQLAEQLGQELEGEEQQWRGFVFDEALGQEILGEDELQATGQATDLTQAGIELIQQAGSAGDSLRAVVVLSDGRQTSTEGMEELVLRARAFGVPIHTLAVGSQWRAPDVELRLGRRRVPAFAGDEVELIARMESHLLELAGLQVELLDAAGEIIQTQQLDLRAGEVGTLSFQLTAPEESAMFTLRLVNPPGDERPSNNEAKAFVQVLKNKTRIFIAEGAPYWDSKFLAQLLRQQEFMEVNSIYRISDERFFRIDSDDQRPAASESDVFPSSQEQMNAYDLIILGKGSRQFLTAERLDLLKSFVRDQGGAVLFARGKSYSGEFPELEVLEPVVWAQAKVSEYSLKPTLDGEQIGLFGQALPGPEDRSWQILPPLRDAYEVDRVKPFTRVLAEGTRPLAGDRGDDAFPLLMVSRYGQGTTALVNADGLWKWDFFPEARELGNMYEEFWTQLVQWMMSYSEFLPGQDFSLRLSPTIVEQNQPVEARIGYRGEVLEEGSAKPRLQLWSGAGEMLREFEPAQSSASTWASIVELEKPGSYRLQLIEPEGELGPDARFEVLAPPTETDVLDADAEYLRRLAEATGGKFLENPQVDELGEWIVDGEMLKEEVDAGVEWQSWWMRWPMAILGVFFLSLEWFLRRRSGLA